MAVGKGSMARASKAAGKKTAVVTNVEEKVVETIAEVAVTESVEETSKAVTKKATPKKAAAKKTTTKKAATKVEKEANVAASVVVAATSEQVMKQIVYQKSSQVLDREVKVNETFGVGEAMPIYFF